MQRNMVMRYVACISILVVLLAGAGVRMSCAAGRARRVDTGGGMIRWSKDSTGIYYVKSMIELDTLYYYDIRTKKRTVYRKLPEFETVYDIAPDGKALITRGEDGISLKKVYLTDRSSSIIYTLMSSLDRNGLPTSIIRDIAWLPSGHILFTEMMPDSHLTLYLIDADGGNLETVATGVFRVFPAGDGSGVYYAKRDRSLNYYNLQTRTEMRLFPGDTVDTVEISPIALSDRQFIYRKHDLLKDTYTTEALDLETKAVSAWQQDARTVLVETISPDGQWGCAVEAGSDFIFFPTPSKIWLVPLVPETAASKHE